MVRVTITVSDGDTVVQTFERTCQPTGDGLRKAAGQAMGWLQAWSVQVTDDQWQADAKHAGAPGLRRIA
jgi:hypothetical protein